MKNLSKFVAVALIALSTACAQTQEETAAAAPAPTVEETNTEESSADNENAEPAEAVTDETRHLQLPPRLSPSSTYPLNVFSPELPDAVRHASVSLASTRSKVSVCPIFTAAAKEATTASTPSKPATKHVIHPRARLLKNE